MRRNSSITSPVVYLFVVLAACAGGPHGEDLRGTLSRVHGYAGREDDSASIRYLEARPDLVEALLRPETVALARVLAEDYASPFDPADAPELVAWARDTRITADLTADRTRRFARALSHDGVLDRDTLRIRGGPLFDGAPAILAALSGRPGVTGLLRDLGREYDYLLRTIHAPALARLLDDEPTRRALARPAVVRGWARVAREGKLEFHPARAREIVVLAEAPGLPETLRRLRKRFELRTGSDGLPVLAAIVVAGRAGDLLTPDHLAILALLHDLPGPPPRLVDLSGTLALSRVERTAAVLTELSRLRWTPRLDDPEEAAAVVALGRRADRADRLRAMRIPEDAGRGARLRSVRALLAVIDGAMPIAEPWLAPGDRAFRPLLPDPGGDRAHLERAILAARGARPIAERPRTTYDETGVSLRSMSRPDLLRILALQRSLEDALLVTRLLDAAIADRDDDTAEHGGTLVLRDARAVWLREEPVPGARPTGDRTHRLAARPDPADVLATYHFHARGGVAVAGPSPGRVVGDIAAARRLGVDGVIVTLLPGRRIDVDFHDTDGRVLDLGVYP